MTEAPWLMTVDVNSRSIRSRIISRCSNPRKTAAKPKPRGGGGFHVVGKARIIWRRSLPWLAQILEACRIDGEEPAKTTTGPGGSGQRSDGLGLVLDHGAPTRVIRPPCLIEAVKKPISRGPNFIDHLALWAATRRRGRAGNRVGETSLTFWPFRMTPSTILDQNHDAR